MSRACIAQLQALHAGFITSVFPDSLTATMVTIVLLAAVLAVAVSPFVLRGYGSRVRQLMLLQQVAVPPASWHARHRRGSSRSPRTGGTSSNDVCSLGDLQRASESRSSIIKRATWLAYALFVIFSPAVLLTGGSVAAGDIIGYCLAVPALGAVPALVNIQPQGSKAFILVCMVTLGLVLGFLEPASGDGVSNVLFLPLLLAALYLVTAHRKLRTAVVVMTVWLTPVLAGVLTAVWFTLPMWSCIDASSGAAEWALAGAGATLALIFFSGFVFAGNKALHGLAQLHERGFLSDISLAAGAGLALIALLLAFTISNEGSFSMWQIALVAIAWIESAMGVYGWVAYRSVRPDVQRSLLVLRVFSTSSATERLLDVVQTRWRFVGPVYEIAGPDLARLNIDAYEVEKFVTSRLHEVFLLSAGDRQQLLDRLDRTADREGRFRVNEMFCLESAWRQTVEELMKMSDAIVLDVRGFGRERQGTGFEVELLARNRLLSRVLAIGDATTDWEYFDGQIRNAGCAPADAARMQGGGRDFGEDLVQALMRAATGQTATMNLA